MLTLQDQKVKWRQLITDAAALPTPQPEKLKAALADFWAETEQHLSATDCEAFIEFAKQEERRGARRVAAAEAEYYEMLRISNVLLQQPLTIMALCPVWLAVED